MGSDERKEHGHRHKKRRHKHRRHHDRDDDENEDDEGKRSGGKTHHHHHRRHHVSSSSSSRHHHRHHSSKQDQQGNHFVEKKKQEQQPEVAKYSGDIEKIDSTDYFLKNPEFCSYLVEARQTYFGELTSETARKLFDEFVLLWNSKSLASKYYEGIGGGAQVPRTRPTSASISRKKRQLVEERESDYSRREAERLRGKDLRRKRFKEGKELLEEMFPKATGRDALREKKAAQRSFAREREASPIEFDVQGAADLLGGGDSFEAAKMRESRRKDNWQKRKEIKQLEMEEKRVRFQAKEEEKLDKFRALLQNGPIKIKKRSDM